MIFRFLVKRSSSLCRNIAPLSVSRSINQISNMKIGTHDGMFHCDEIMACIMLKQLPEFKDATIVRTRDMNILNTCDVVVDVGAEFDHKKKRYDHHQREFNETLSTLRPELGDDYKIKLSSAGLIYTYYGEQVIQGIVPKETPLRPEDLRHIYKKVYEALIEEIDAIDNGISMTEAEPRYKIRSHLSARVARLNPEWNSKNVGCIDDLFKLAMAIVSEEFFANVNYFLKVWFPARDFVRAALLNRSRTHESGEIIEFKHGCPWKDHLFDLEREMGIAGVVKYVIFYDKPNSWRVQPVPLTATSFMARKSLKRDWWGVRDEVLSNMSGIANCVFCHSNGFIGGNTTREGALRMAEVSLYTEN